MPFSPQEEREMLDRLERGEKEEADKINAVQVANLDKKAIGSLRAYAKTGKAPGQFIEVMACEGGCITGPCAHNEIAAGKRQLTQELAKREETY